MTLSEGAPAPSVTATNQDGETASPSFEDPTVVYFYPRDATPGCTTEARGFERERESYEDAGVTIYGVSTDDVDDHRAFCEAEGLGFDLLADPSGDLVEAFDVDARRGAAARTTFVLADGEVKAVYEGVDPDGHAREVLQDVLEADLASPTE